MSRTRQPLRDAAARSPAELHGREADNADDTERPSAPIRASEDADPDISCRLLRNDASLITDVDASMVDVLGWRPEQMVGKPSTAFIHPEDQPSAVAAWFDMIGEPGATRNWRGRYRTASGGWKWVETVNTNHLEDPDAPVVVSMMSCATPDAVGVEEELRVRKQLLSRLSDALPVGVFQIDANHRITFTNDRLHVILGVPAAATIAAQFARVVDEDRHELAEALSAALDDRPVDDLELRLCIPDGEEGCAVPRVCLVSLRPLTDEVDAISGAIGVLSDVTEQVQLRRELEARATTDGLTGCLNRAATLELLEVALARSATARQGLAVVFVDLDQFKAVNDRLGHAAGDELLVEAARRLRTGLRTGDEVGRLGGDEFLVICPDVATPTQAIGIARRASERLHSKVRIAGHEIGLRASFGVAWTDCDASPDALIARSDSAMYQAKLDQSRTVALAS